jgi:signal transduction histidine kinase
VRRRLFLVTLAVTTLLVAAFALPLGVLIREVARDRAITEAERDSTSLSTVLAVDPEPALLGVAIGLTTAGSEGRLTVLFEDGTQVGDQSTVDPDAATLARARNAFSRTTAGGIDVYTPVVLPDEVVVLRVRVPEADISEGVASAWAVLAGVALALIVISVAATDRLARSVTRPAADLARTSRELAAGDTTARASVAGPPEIAAVADALNLLADRIDELLTAERERVADLSHRLRTPLTALRLDAEGHGAAALVEDVDRLEAEVSEIIRAARRPLHETVTVRCDLAQVMSDRAAFWGALADDDGRRWTASVEPAGPHTVRLAGADAEAAVDVLLGNVFAHTPDGTPYALAVTAADGRVQLVVEDGGPGIADADGLLDRGASAGGSTGLGLDIAASAARAAGGELRVETSAALGGARIVLDLPAAEEAR